MSENIAKRKEVIEAELQKTKNEIICRNVAGGTIKLCGQIKAAL